MTLDLSKKYYDHNRNERNILEMVKLEPQWAAERIHRLEGELEQKEDFANVVNPAEKFSYDDETIHRIRNKCIVFYREFPDMQERDWHFEELFGIVLSLVADRNNLKVKAGSGE